MARFSNSIEIYNTPHHHRASESITKIECSSVLFVCLLNDKILRRKKKEKEEKVTVAQDKLRLSIDSVGIGHTHTITQSRPSLLSSISIFRDFLYFLFLFFTSLVQRNPRHSAFFFLLSTGHIRIENQSSGYGKPERRRKQYKYSDIY